MFLEIAVVALSILSCVVIWQLWLAWKVIWKLTGQVKTMQDRFAEAGITFADQAATQVRVAEKWVDYDGVADEDLPVRSNVHISKREDWLDLN